VMRAAIDVQKARSAYEQNLRPLRPAEAFYLGTLGGARALGKMTEIGTLDPGKEADLLLFDVTATLPYGLDHGSIEDLAPEDIISLCIYRGGPQATVEAFVRGKSVYQRSKTGASDPGSQPAN
jgi:guanine deaminase